MRRTVSSIAWGAGGALALAGFMVWLSGRAETPLSEAPAGSARQVSAQLSPSAESAAPAQPNSAATAAAKPAEVASGRRLPTANDEASLMAELRALQGSNPARAVELARAGNERFPDSPDAAERASILIHALSALGRASEARGEAEHMVNHYPDTAWVREIERFTGAHRHRNLRLNAEGQLESY